jgi:hypothetical protein
MSPRRQGRGTPLDAVRINDPAPRLCSSEIHAGSR